MTFTALLSALARSWVLIVACVVAGVLAATAFVVLSPRTYASTASVYVTALADADNPVTAAAPLQDAFQGTLLAQQKIKSYPDLVVSDRVLLPVVERFDLDDSTAELADRVSVVTSAESTVLRVTVEDPRPERAAELANAITSGFIDVVGRLEGPEASGQPTQISIEVVDEARADDDPVSPRRNLTLAVGVALGLLLGITAAVVRATVAGTSSGSHRRAARRRGTTRGTPAPAPAGEPGTGEAPTEGHGADRAELGAQGDGELPATRSGALEPAAAETVDAPRG